MYTTTTSSKSAVRFTIDFFNKTITGTKASFDKGQLNVSELARVCELSRTTVYKYISLLEG